MAEKRTESSRYKSLYGGGFVTPAQILAEIMCERMAKRNGDALPLKFWTVCDKWNKSFRWQLAEANKLLKVFHESVVSRVLRSNEGKFFLSLNSPKLRPLLEQEQKKYDAEMIRIKNVERVDTVKDAPAPTTYAGKKSKLSLLKEIDNDC